MSELVFHPRGTKYRGRGRPPAPVPQAILSAVWKTTVEGTECRISVEDESPEDVADLRRALRRAGTQLNLTMHISRVKNEIVFWGENKS